MLSCFISHTWREGEHHFAMRLSEALEQRKIKVWIDEKYIIPGTHIKERIRKGVNHDSDAFLFAASEVCSLYPKYNLQGRAYSAQRGADHDTSSSCHVRPRHYPFGYTFRQKRHFVGQ